MRAVFYCRVSTDEEAQLNALEDQVLEAKKCIQKMNWELVDEYIDEAKSGTTTIRRDEYKRLFEDLSTNKFDVVVIKSQDRLMRNVKEWYVFLDALITNKKQLYFYLDSRFYSSDDALITGIKAILAEEYSRELSKKIRNAHKHRQESGKSILITNATWGYNKIGKKVVINEDEAVVVRTIYNLCLQGYGSRLISKHLSNEGVKSRTGGNFAEVTVRKIIRNPLYKGTVIMNKKTTDFNTKKTIINPKEDWVIHENAVTPIVSDEVWEEANKLMDQRSKQIKSSDNSTKRIGKNQGQYELSSKIVCGICGKKYWRRYRRNSNNPDEILISWICSEYASRGRRNKDKQKDFKAKKVKTPNSGCDNIHIKETELTDILLEVFKKITDNNKQAIISNAINIVCKALNTQNTKEDFSKNKTKQDKILNQKNTLLDKLLDETISSDDYKRKNEELDIKLNKLKKEEKELKDKEDLLSDVDKRIEDITQLLSSGYTENFEKAKLLKHINKIIVFPDKLDIYFDFYEKLKYDLKKKQDKQYQYVVSDKNLASVHNQVTQTLLRHKKFSYHNADKG